LAIFPLLALLNIGCGGINASGTVSPATFLLPGLVNARPEAVQPEVPPTVPQTNLSARSH